MYRALQFAAGHKLRDLLHDFGLRGDGVRGDHVGPYLLYCLGHRLVTGRDLLHGAASSAVSFCKFLVMRCLRISTVFAIDPLEPALGCEVFLERQRFFHCRFRLWPDRQFTVFALVEHPHAGLYRELSHLDRLLGRVPPTGRAGGEEVDEARAPEREGFLHFLEQILGVSSSALSPYTGDRGQR